MVNMDEVIDWKVNLVEITGNPDMPESYKPVAAVNLEALLDALDSSEFELLDANQIEIKKLSKDTVAAIGPTRIKKVLNSENIFLLV